MCDPRPIGDVVRCGVTVRDIDDVLADPSDITLTIQAPGQMPVTHPITDVQHPSVGEFYFDLLLSTPGTYNIRWFSTGQNQGVVQDGVYVYGWLMP